MEDTDIIKELYKSLPKSVCKEGCSKCCSDMIQFSPSEEKRMGGYEWNGKCSHLIDGKCSVYENRPFVCRLFGTSDMLTCEGCTPERYLTEEETIKIVHEYTLCRNREREKIGGAPPSNAEDIAT